MTLHLTQSEIDHISYGYDMDAARSSTIHSDCYVDPRFLDIEREQVFHKTWQFLCHE